ncbi:NirA family protein [Beijerinckia sp. L45]|uniref:NirA family protein n=1 Tax=Beijerinckia sp. L45 TaxID=1641855 RepID=UPI00131E7352|nr:NirA family protein [Beijerinckia sp. L45]
MDGDFTSEQKRYLEGFTSGIQVGRLKPAGGGAAAPAAPGGPDAPGLIAQAKTEAAGKKLCDQEKWKRDEHPFDAYPRLKDQAAKDEFPKPADNFRWRYYGLFYVAPAQDSYMCRLRIHNGVLKHWQFAGLADIAEDFAAPFSHATTRANLQLREIPARNGIEVIERIIDLGLCSKGSGADNIRNVTGDATAGIAPHELLDTRPYAREWHYAILNDRAMYGLPRKFNVAFDGGGPIPTLEDTNDIGFQAVQVLDGAGIEPGVYFRLVLGGISGHKDLARDTGVVLKPADATKVAAAIVKVFVDTGDRTNRTKARLKYVLDDWGFAKFLDAVEAKLGHKLDRVDPAHVAPRPAQDRLAHVGVHPQKQEGLSYIGVVLPVGKMLVAQMHELAAISYELGDGDIRLTVWQNLLISGVPADKLDEAKARIEATGLEWRASSIRAGLVACTGSQGCKFAAAATKAQAEEIAAYLEPKVSLDTPVNIHLTGCHNSCAQHYIGDIGLIGARVPINDDGDTVDGYDIYVGGGFSTTAAIGRQIYPAVAATEAPQVVERLLKSYLAHRTGPEETFHGFSNGRDIDSLKALADAVTP